MVYPRVRAVSAAHGQYCITNGRTARPYGNYRTTHNREVESSNLSPATESRPQVYPRVYPEAMKRTQRLVLVYILAAIPAVSGLVAAVAIPTGDLGLAFAVIGSSLVVAVVGLIVVRFVVYRIYDWVEAGK